MLWLFKVTRVCSYLDMLNSNFYNINFIKVLLFLEKKRCSLDNVLLKVNGKIHAIGKQNNDSVFTCKMAIPYIVPILNNIFIPSKLYEE